MSTEPAISTNQMGRAEIASATIGDIVMEKLRRLDYIAYIRFASVYRDFTDITDLKQEVDTLVSSSTLTNQDGGQLSLLPDEKNRITDRSHPRGRK